MATDKEIYSYTNTIAGLLSLLAAKMRGIDTDAGKNWIYKDADGDMHVTANQKKYTSGAWAWEDPEFRNVYASSHRGMTIEGVKDADTYLDMTTADNALLNVGGIVFADFNENAAQKYIWFNGDGVDIDFQIGDAPYDFFIEGSSGNIGMGTATMDSKLHIWKASAGSVTATAASILTLEDDDNCYLSFLTPNNKSSGLAFGNPDSETECTMLYSPTEECIQLSYGDALYHNLGETIDIGGCAVSKDGGCVLNVGTGYAGAPKSDVSQICILNLSGLNVADNDGTTASILFKQYYYDATTPDTFDAGRIRVGNEIDCTSDTATHDGFMALDVAVNGTLTEAARVNSKGELILPVTGVVALKETTTPSAVTDYGRIYTKSDNKLYFQDGGGTEHEIAFV